MMLSLLTVALLPYLFAHVQAYGSTADVLQQQQQFYSSATISGSKYPAGSVVDGQCTSSKSCANGLTCTALPTSSVSYPTRSKRWTWKVPAGPSFCVAAPKPATCPKTYTKYNFYHECCTCKIDLAYVIDRSGSMGSEYSNAIQFLEDVTEELANVDQHPFCIYIAVFSFTSTSVMHLPLTSGSIDANSNINFAAVLSALPMNPPSGLSYIDDGMLFANDHLNSFGRSFACNVMLVITDYLFEQTNIGNPSIEEVMTASNTIRSSGTCINAVGTSTLATLADHTMLLAITGSADVEWYSHHAQLNTLVSEVQLSLCDKCQSACYCPSGYTEYEGRCYKKVGPACWFDGEGLCAAMGATFTTNQQAAATIGGTSAWYNFGNPMVSNYFSYCLTAGSQCIKCCELKPIVCEKPCNGLTPTSSQIKAFRYRSTIYGPKDADNVRG